jgi:hypothetical protein
MGQGIDARLRKFCRRPPRLGQYGNCARGTIFYCAYGQYLSDPSFGNPIGCHGRPAEKEQQPGQPVLSVNQLLRNFNLVCLWRRMLLSCLLELLVQFPGPGILLLLVLLDTLLYALCNQFRLFLGLPRPLCASGNPQGLVLARIRVLEFS